MKKVITILAIAAFMFSVDATAQTQKKKEVAKTEKACCSADKKEVASMQKSAEGEKKSCGTEAKASCCSSKKAEAKKEE
ncbi:hypothetical protein [Flavobacterium sp.]|jgi:hypothetical protein|uniref:hypothetical protein n=1 Tax=Flavobacterium sp. TaxID=239 RepID=UPI002A7EDD8D|nr:hypothetical protein [Flavobacterium sp.]